MHDSSLITLIIFMISGLVALNALSYYSERLMLFPSVIWVLCLGMIYGALNHFELLHLPELYIDPNIILFALVPVLIFAATKKMCLHHFRKVLKESSLLATVGIVISMTGVWFSTEYFTFHSLNHYFWGVSFPLQILLLSVRFCMKLKISAQKEKCSLEENQSLMMALLLRSSQPFL